MKTYLAIVLAAVFLAAPMRADQNSDLEQVIQNASKGQSAETSAQVREFAESHQDEISGITQGYRAYLHQIQAMTNDEGAASPPPPVVSGTNAPVATAPAAPAPATAANQVATGLQTASLQPSAGLTTSHLAGATPLPEADPVSSVSTPTAAQLQHGAEVQSAMRARKRALMQTPLHWQD